MSYNRNYDSSNSELAHVRGEAFNKIFPEILKITNVTRFEIGGNASEELICELADDNPKTSSTGSLAAFLGRNEELCL